MKVIFKNWDKFQNPKKSGTGQKIEHTSWLRLENKLFFNPLWEELDHAEFRCFVFMLCASSINSNTGIFMYSHRLHHRMSGLDDTIFKKTISKLVKLQVVEVRSERGRYASGPPSTNPTNVTNEPYGTESIEAGALNLPVAVAPGALEKTSSKEAWKSYEIAYSEKYGEPPVRNAKTNSLLKQMLGRVAGDELPHILNFYVNHKNSYYAQRGHSLECALKDAEKLRTEWKTGKMKTNTEIQVEDKSAANISQLQRVLENKL